MGLDMYLEAEIYISGGDWESDDVKEQKKKVREAFPELKNVDTNNINYTKVIVEVGYWRKSNQIHKWFVDNVQGGNDDCRDYEVSRKQLEKLKSVCEELLRELKIEKGIVQNGSTFKDGKEILNMEEGEVITNPELAEELLPTQGGFFFGGTGYDQYYIDDLKQTVEIINRCLTLPDKWYFSYHSSW